MIKLSRVVPSRSFVRYSFILRSFAFLGLTMLVSGCKNVERSSIGASVDSPIAIASHPTLPVSYVLNASLGGEYSTGSIQSFEMESGSVLKLLGVSDVPRLGTAVAVAKNGEFLVAGFSGSVAELRVFSLNESGVVSPSSKSFDRLVLPSGRISSVKLVQRADLQDWLVIVSQADRSVEAKISIYRYSTSEGFQRLLSIPNDIYTPSRENVLGAYTMAWGSPVVFESLGLMVAFPAGTVGYAGIRPPVLDWLTGKVTTSTNAIDFRTVSILALDLTRLGAPEGAQAALGYIPLAFNKDGKAGNPQNVDAVENKTLDFRTSFQSALAIDASGSVCQPNAAATELTAHTAVVAVNNRTADLVALGGFNSVAQELRSRLNQGQFQPVLGSLLQPQPLYVTSTDAANAPETDTLVPELHLIRSKNNLCTIMWLRVERGRSILGEERSQFEMMTSAVGMDQSKFRIPLAGMAAFAVNGSIVLGGSFGANQIQQFIFDGVTLQPGGLFK